MTWWRKLLDLDPKPEQPQAGQARSDVEYGPPRRIQKFGFTGVDAESRSVRGIEKAVSMGAAYKQVRARGIEPVDFTRKPGLLGADPTRQRVSNKDVGQFSRQLAVFVRANAPLVQSLLAIADETESKTLRTIIIELADGVEAGRPLDEVAAEYPKAFPPHYVGILKSARRTGQLADVLEQLSKYLEGASTASAKVKTALVYPVILIVLAIAAGYVIIKYAMPALLNFFASFNAKVPFATRVLIDGSNALGQYWAEMVGAVLLVVGAFIVARRTTRGRAKLDHWVFKVPVLGSVVRMIILERVCRVLSAMLAAGVPEADAFETAALVANNAAYRDALRYVRSEMLNGYGISRPVARTGLFPPTTRLLFRTGEATASLSEQLEVAADYQDQDLKTRIDRVLAALDPLLMLIVGGMIAFLAYAIVAAMYGVFAQIHIS